LFFLFGVALGGVVDLQLLDVAQRLLAGVPCARVSGLGFVCERTPRAGLSPRERERLAAVKRDARALFAPELGGSYDVWKARPLPAVLFEYCTDAALSACWTRTRASGRSSRTAARSRARSTPRWRAGWRSR
jgi:hypothetical protein